MIVNDWKSTFLKAHLIYSLSAGQSCLEIYRGNLRKDPEKYCCAHGCPRKGEVCSLGIGDCWGSGFWVRGSDSPSWGTVSSEGAVCRIRAQGTRDYYWTWAGSCVVSLSWVPVIETTTLFPHNLSEVHVCMRWPHRHNQDHCDHCLKLNKHTEAKKWGWETLKLSEGENVYDQLCWLRKVQVWHFNDFNQ